jgi:glycosyltransferase involved in cell wall biosynthesis
MMHSLNKNVHELGLDRNIKFTGYLPEKQKFEAMKQSKVFIFPSHPETFAIVICEAMSCGLPVLAYDLPAYRGTYKKGIVTVPIGDTNELTRWALTILNSTELREKLAIDALEQGNQFDWDNIARRELEIVTGAFSLG